MLLGSLCAELCHRYRLPQRRCCLQPSHCSRHSEASVTMAVQERGNTSFGCWGLFQDLEDQEIKQQMNKSLRSFYAFSRIGKVRTSVLKPVSFWAGTRPTYSENCTVTLRWKKIKQTCLSWGRKASRVTWPVREKKFASSTWSSRPTSMIPGPRIRGLFWRWWIKKLSLCFWTTFVLHEGRWYSSTPLVRLYRFAKFALHSFSAKEMLSCSKYFCSVFSFIEDFSSTGHSFYAV